MPLWNFKDRNCFDSARGTPGVSKSGRPSGLVAVIFGVLAQVFAEVHVKFLTLWCVRNVAFDRVLIFVAQRLLSLNNNDIFVESKLEFKTAVNQWEN